MIAVERRAPMTTLDDEHRVIEKVLDALDRFRKRPDAVPVPVWAQALDFLKCFADGLHHAKEETVLFPMLAEHGLPSEGGPLACMLHDHSTGRELRAAMSAALPMLGADPEAAKRLSDAAGDYVGLMRFHIRKEDGMLFPMAKSMLDPAAQRKLASEFERVSAKELPEDEVARYLQLAEDLALAARSLELPTSAGAIDAARATLGDPCPR